MRRQDEENISITAWNTPSLIDPRYMKGDSEIPTYTESNDDFGNTLDYFSGPIGAPPPHRRRGSYHVPGETRNPEEEGVRGIGIDTRNWGRKEQENQGISGPNYPYYTGGTYLHPEYLSIGGGRIVHPEFLRE